jgi:hypothetical protein
MYTKQNRLKLSLLKAIESIQEEVQEMRYSQEKLPSFDILVSEFDILTEKLKELEQRYCLLERILTDLDETVYKMYEYSQLVQHALSLPIQTRVSFFVPPGDCK